MKTKLTKREVFTSVVIFIISYAVLVLLCALNILINTDGHLIAFINQHVDDAVIVSVSFFVLTAIIYCYYFFELKEVLASSSKIIEIFLLVAISLLICNVIAKYAGATARPLLFFPLMAAMFFKRKDALFLNTVFAFMQFVFNRIINSGEIGGSILMIESFAGILTMFCAGTISIFVIDRIKTRIGSVFIAVVLFFPVLLINFVMQTPAIDSDFLHQVLELVLSSALCCVFSVLLFLFFLPVFEAMFSELTPFRLRELTSDNAKLMKKLKENALGTYNHSIVVAQLAEACASAIGEDPELARAAAYYHDVGKLKNPEMFTENQSEYDLHKELTPELSVDIIRSHARDGAKLIKKNHLPDFFADVAVEHHGTLPIKYFYAKALQMSDGELNAGNYSYAGPTPTSKIAAIIMIADASEAAARSLSVRTPEKVEKLVSNLVEERMNLDQFVDCNITMRELTVITRTVVNGLTGVYHSRVQYPKLVLSKKK